MVSLNEEIRAQEERVNIAKSNYDRLGGDAQYNSSISEVQSAAFECHRCYEATRQFGRSWKKDNWKRDSDEAYDEAESKFESTEIYSASQAYSSALSTLQILRERAGKIEKDISALDANISENRKNIKNNNGKIKEQAKEISSLEAELKAKLGALTPDNSLSKLDENCQMIRLRDMDSDCKTKINQPGFFGTIANVFSNREKKLQDKSKECRECLDLINKISTLQISNVALKNGNQALQKAIGPSEENKRKLEDKLNAPPAANQATKDMINTSELPNMTDKKAGIAISNEQQQQQHPSI